MHDGLGGEVPSPVAYATSDYIIERLLGCVYFKTLLILSEVSKKGDIFSPLCWPHEQSAVKNELEHVTDTKGPLSLLFPTITCWAEGLKLS